VDAYPKTLHDIRYADLAELVAEPSANAWICAVGSSAS
jgi:hypothetical protein